MRLRARRSSGNDERDSSSSSASRSWPVQNARYARPAAEPSMGTRIPALYCSKARGLWRSVVSRIIMVAPDGVAIATGHTICSPSAARCGLAICAIMASSSKPSDKARTMMVGR